MLIATSTTLTGISKLINDYWMSDKYTVNPDTLRIEHPEKDVNDRFKVVKKGKRYRFES